MIATQTIDTDIRPISDLRNKFAEIADYVQGGNTIIFTRNGYGCMVTMSFEAYKHLNDPRHWRTEQSRFTLRGRYASLYPRAVA